MPIISLLENQRDQDREAMLSKFGWGNGNGSSAWTVPGVGGSVGGGTVSIPNPGTVGAGAGSYVNNMLSSYAGMPGIQQDLSGVIAPDVKRQLYQAAAERGVGIGSYDSANVDANLLRSIGLTSDALRSRGQGELVSALGALPKFDTGSQYVDPGLQAQLGTQEYIANMNARSSGGGGARYGGGGGGYSAPAQAPGYDDSATYDMIDQMLGRYGGGAGSDPWTSTTKTSTAPSSGGQQPNSFWGGSTPQGFDPSQTASATFNYEQALGSYPGLAANDPETEWEENFANAGSKDPWEYYLGG